MVHGWDLPGTGKPSKTAEMEPDESNAQVPTKSKADKVALLVRGEREGLSNIELATLAGKERKTIGRWKEELADDVQRALDGEENADTAVPPQGIAERIAADVAAVRERIEHVADRIDSILEYIEEIAAAVLDRVKKDKK